MTRNVNELFNELSPEARERIARRVLEEILAINKKKKKKTPAPNNKMRRSSPENKSR